MTFEKPYTLYISLISVFASIFVVLNLFNIGFPVIGVEGAKPISLSESIALLIGYVFGWEVGLFSVFIGGLISGLLYPAPPFFILNFLPAAVSAFMIGFVVKHFYKSILLYSSFLIIYMLYPYVGVLWLYPIHPWFHILILITVLVLRKYKYNSSQSMLDLNKIHIFIYCLFSTLAGQVVGTILFETLYYPTVLSVEGFRYIWMITTYLYPIERVILSIIAFLLITPTLVILSRYKSLSHIILK